MLELIEITQTVKSHVIDGAVAVDSGSFQVQRVTYASSGESCVEPLTGWLSLEELKAFAESLTK